MFSNAYTGKRKLPIIDKYKGRQKVEESNAMNSSLRNILHIS